MNQVIEPNLPLLYVPLAMDENEYPYDDCYDWICEQLINVSVSRVDMVRTFDELYLKKLDDYCAIFIGGGNTYKLLKGLKESGSFEKIKNYINNNGIVFGGSAGAVIFGKDINIIAVMDENAVKFEDTTGFNVINNVSIFPHYTNRKSRLSDEENNERHIKFTNAIIDFSNSVGSVIAYPEENTLFINDDVVEMIGDRDYYYIENGNIIKYRSSDLDSIKSLKLR